MADKVLARRTAVSITFGGTDITQDIKPYLLNLIYTDDTDDTSDDLKIELQDRDGVWMEQWLTEAVEAAAGGKLSISAVISPGNWKQNDELKTGMFELDSVDASGPSSVVTINAASLAFSGSLRQTRKSKAWKNYSLSGIASEIAANGGMACMYESSTDPHYKRVEQTRQSDIAFLKKLCRDAGISIKATDGKIVLYDQTAYEAKPPIFTIEKGGNGGDLKYKLHARSGGAPDAKGPGPPVQWGRRMQRAASGIWTRQRGRASKGRQRTAMFLGSSAWRSQPRQAVLEKRRSWQRNTCGCITKWREPQRLPCRGM